MECQHLWIRRKPQYRCTKCKMTTDTVDALIGGEMDWRDNETWYDFVDPIRREYLIKKDKEREKALSTI